MSKKISKKAFTLVETLIMVAVVGIIAVITVVSLKNMSPDKDAVLVRKAYTEMSKAVAALVNDEQLYPSAKVAFNFQDNGLNEIFNSISAVEENGNISPDSGVDPGDVQIKTSNTNLSSGISGGDLDKLEKLTGNLNSSSNVLSDTTVRNGASAYNSSNKFAYNFAKLFDTRSSSCSGNYCKFTTPDGMAWKVTDNFGNGGGNANIDVNIYNNGKDANTYYFQVDAGGKISVVSGKSTTSDAIRYLNSRKMTKSK